MDRLSLIYGILRQVRLFRVRVGVCQFANKHYNILYREQEKEISAAYLNFNQRFALITGSTFPTCVYKIGRLKIIKYTAKKN